MADTTTVDPVDELLPIIKKAEKWTPENPVSPKGARGPYQVTPKTAAALGHDPSPAALDEPGYNEQVARSALMDLGKQNKGFTDKQAIVAGYNASPTAIYDWKKSGPPLHRDDTLLPEETKNYIASVGLASAEQPAPPERKPGEAWEADVVKARTNGYSWDDIAEYREQQAAKAKAGGYTKEQIDEYFGASDPAPLVARMRAREEAHHAAEAAKQDNFFADDTNPLTAFIKTVQGTPVARALDFATGSPDNKPFVLPENAPMATRIASDAGWLLGQAPETILALLAAPEGAIAKTTSAFALPAFTRSEFSVALDQGQVSGPWDYAARQAGAIWATAKSAATGTFLGLGGAIIAPLGWAATAATELSVMTGLGSALEGRLPTHEDWIDNTIMLLGLKGGFAVTGGVKKSYQVAKKNIIEHWAKTGEDMDVAVQRATADPVFNETLRVEPPPPVHPDDSVSKDGEFQIKRSVC